MHGIGLSPRFSAGDILRHETLNVLEGGVSLPELDAKLLFDDLGIPAGR